MVCADEKLQNHEKASSQNTILHEKAGYDRITQPCAEKLSDTMDARGTLPLAKAHYISVADILPQSRVSITDPATPSLRMSCWHEFWTQSLILSIRLMRFLFVKPWVCLQLLSDSTSPGTPLLFGYALPTAGRARDFHPLDFTYAGHTNSSPNWQFFTSLESCSHLKSRVSLPRSPHCRDQIHKLLLILCKRIRMISRSH